MTYKEIDITQANRLINNGPVILIATKSETGLYNIAPIAWNTPLTKNPPKMISVVGQRHKTWENIKSQKEYVVCIPHFSQAQMVQNTGLISGSETDKYKRFNIDGFKPKSVDAMIPVRCVAYIECRVDKMQTVINVDIVIGDIISASVDEKGFDNRLLSEKYEGKTLHHNGGNFYSVFGDSIIETEITLKD